MFGPGPGPCHRRAPLTLVGRRAARFFPETRVDEDPAGFILFDESG